MTDRERFERFQQLLRVVYVQMKDMRFSDGPPSAYFYTSLRENLQRAGATQDDLRQVVIKLIRWMVREAGRETAEPLFELIAEHLVGEDLEVGFDRDGHVTVVAFPNADVAH